MFRVMCDLDQIVVESLKPWIEAYNAEYQDNLTIDRFYNWDFKGCVKSECQDIHKYIRQPGFFYNCRPLPGAVEALRYLRSTGKFDIMICTAAMHPNAFYDKARWFQEHLGFLGKEQLFMGHRKEWLKADAYIDDSPSNLLAIRKEWPMAYVITIDYPFNRSVRKTIGIDHIALDYNYTEHAWKSIVEYLERVELHRGR